MNPFVSDQEKEIRQAVVSRIRVILPGARIIHELNVERGDSRADVAAVTDQSLFLFEIKSEKDTLHRLGSQIRNFVPVCHGLVVVAHEKWCGPATDAGYPNCDVRKIMEFGGVSTLWQFPEPETRFRTWQMPYRIQRPWSWKMLHLLWVDELKHVCRAHKIGVTSRANSTTLITLILDTMTSAEIERAVCKALRTRKFAEADDISEVAA
jgi:hypothetical protein